MIVKRVIDNIIEKRVNKIINLFDGFLKPGEKILDVGAGGGWIAREIKERKKTDITLLDISNFNCTDLELILYDGENIPFPDDSFDTSLLVFTLHHCKSPLEILRETKRVTREKIIVIEDIPTSFFNKALLYFWDIVTNIPSLIRPPGENIFFNFKKFSQWQEIFKTLQLKEIYQKKFQSNKIINHALFVLQK